MATPNTLATIQSLTKTFFTPERVQKLYSRDYPLLSRLRKVPFVGDPAKVPLITGRGAGIGSTLTGASASAKGVSSEAFLIKMAKYVGVIPLDDEVMQTLKGDKGGFVDYVKTEFEAKITGMGLTHSTHLFGNGGGAIGQVASIVSDSFVLTDRSDALNFWPGDIIRASTADGNSGTLKAGQSNVISVDRDTGTVYCDDLSTITGTLATSDYLFISDLWSNNADTIVAKGLRKWITPSPATDTFWSVARTGKPELSGIRLPSAQQTGGPVDRIKNLATHMWSTLRSGKGGVAFVNPLNWARAASDLEAQGFRPIEVGETEAIAGYDKLTIVTEAGRVELLSDPSCRTTDGFLLNLNHWWIHHRGESGQMVRIVSSPNGEEYVPSSSILGFDVRLASYWNLASNAPWTGGYTPMPGVSDD